RALEPPHDLDGHLGALVGMPIESDLAVGRNRAATRLRDIVQQDSERYRLGASALEHRKRDARVPIHVALGMEILGLCASGHFNRFGQQYVKQAAFSIRAIPRAAPPSVI